MKNRFFTLLGACLVGMSAFAQWTAPDLPTAASELISGHTYQMRVLNGSDVQYFSNLAAYGMWSTATGLVEQSDALSVTLTSNTGTVYELDEETGDTLSTSEEFIGWTVYSSYGYTFISGVNDYSSATLAAGEMHVDMGSQGHQYFNFVKKSDYVYNICVMQTDTLYGAGTDYADTYWGWSSLVQEDFPVAVWALLDKDAEGNYCDWELVDMAQYTAQYALYEALVASDDYSSLLASEIAAAAAVYENSSATVEELEAAATTLNAAIMEKKVYAVLDGATSSSPKDGTSLITNADFSAASMDGWTNSFVSGTTATNVQYQSATYSNTSYTYINHEGDEVYPNCTGFIEAWTWYWYNSALVDDQIPSIGDASISQTMTGLPAGMYKLSCDAIAVQQYTTVSEQYGVQLFATGGTVDVYKVISTGNGVPEHYSLTFVSDGGDVTVGLRTENTNCNWIGADNFELLYYGEVTGSAYQILLENAVSEYESTYADLDDFFANADVKSAYEAQLAASKEVAEDLTLSDEAYQESQAALDAAATALATSITEYETVVTQIANINAICTKATAQGWTSLVDDLADYRDTLQEGYEEESLTSEDVAAISTTIGTMLADYISTYCKAGDDISLLIQNPDFDTDFSGWTVVSGTTPTWGGMAQGENTIDGAPTIAEIASGNAEVYCATFDIAQTLTNVPAGLYTLSCHALARDDGSDGIGSYLYASVDGVEQLQQVKNLLSEGSETQLWASDDSNYTWFDDSYSTLTDGTSAYVPNGMNGANVYFYAGYYKNSFNFVLTEASDVTIGIRNTDATDWVLFDAFGLVYQGNDASAFAAYIQELIDEASELAVIVKEVDDQILNAIANGEDACLSDATTDECLAAISELKAAIAAAEECNEAVEELQTLYDYTNEIRIVEVDSEYEGLAELLETISSAIEDEEIETMAQVAQWMIDLKAEFTKHVMYGLTASEDEPADITPVILMAEGTDYNGDASTYGWETNGSVGSGDGCIELWNQSADTYFQQTIYGLAEGYYRLGVQGFYRGAGYISTVSSELNDPYYKYVTLYAGEASTPLLRIIDDAVAYADIAGDTGSDETYYVPTGTSTANTAFENGLYQNYLQFQVAEGVDEVVIGLVHTAEVSEDWMIWDNWTLEYLGTDAPAEDVTTAIQGVQTAAATAIYDLTGRQVGKAVKGIYIINGQKVVVK